MNTNRPLSLVQRLVGWMFRPSTRPLCAIALVAFLAGCSNPSQFVRAFDWRSTPPAPIHSVADALSVVREGRNPGDRQRAFRYLGQPTHYEDDPAKREEVAEILAIALLSETDPNVRISVVRSLGTLGSPRCLAALAEAARDSQPRVRVAACNALADSGNPVAIDLLAELLASDPHLDVRLAAAAALGQLRDRRAAEVLLAGLVDPDVAIRHRCGESLRAITGAEHAYDPAVWNQEIQTAGLDAAPRRSWLSWLPGSDPSDQSDESDPSDPSDG